MSLEQEIHKINALKAEIDSLGILSNENLQRIHDKFRLELNFHSNKMEGNSLTKAETQSVMLNNVTVAGKPLKDILEIQGHDAIIREIQGMVRGEINITENKIKNIHSGIMFETEEDKKKQIGKWKTIKNYLYNYRGERMDFTAPEDVAVEMNSLINWLNNALIALEKGKSKTHILEIAAEFHLRFVSIHPFYDGNGRTARILMNLIFIRYGYPSVIIKDEEKDAYSQYLAHAQEYEKNHLPFYEFIARSLIRSQALYLKGARGEDMRDLDDFDKELRLMQINLMDKRSQKIKKSPELLQDFFKRSIYPLYLKLLTQLNKIDYLFKRSEKVIVLKDTRYSFWNEDFESFIECNLENPKMFEEFIIGNLWENFKQLEDKHFNILAKVVFNFQDFNYIISLDQSGDKITELTSKFYSEQLTELEIDKIVDDVSHRVLKLIKEEYEIHTGKKL